MIPEAVIGMLACGRIGAIHSVVFGGFASNELASRIDDSKAKLLVTASCGFEPGRTVEYKPFLVNLNPPPILGFFHHVTMASGSMFMRADCTYLVILLFLDTVNGLS